MANVIQGFYPDQAELLVIESYIDTEVAAIKAKTDNLPAFPASETTVTAVKAKTDTLPASPANEVTSGYINHRFHNLEIWFGKRADQSGNNWADRNSLTPYQAKSGNNIWGTGALEEAKVFGSADTPVGLSATYGNVSRVLVVGNSSATVYKLRLIFGLTTSADAVVAGQFTEFVFLRGVADQVRKMADLQNLRIPVGYKRWMQVWNVTNGATIDFLIGMREYPPPLSL